MWNRLVDLGQAREEILAAWIAKEELRALLALAVPACTSRRQISHRLWAFYQWCAEIELYRLAQTIQAWRVQIEAFALTGAAGEGVNRLIELETRNAFGFRNPSTNAYDHAAQAVRASWRRTLSGPAVKTEWIRELERAKTANYVGQTEILKAASVFFAGELDPSSTLDCHACNVRHGI
jgi:hypothetical protein